jgi:HAAS domain-containing protein
MPGAIADYLERLERELRLKRAPRRRLLAEVEDHLRSSADELGADLPGPEAEHRAVERFGAAATVARHFAQTVAASSARRSSYWLGGAFVAYAATAFLFALTAGPQFADFPQGAPSALALQVAAVAFVVSLVRTARWRRSPLMPEDRVRLLANGAVIGTGAVAAGLVLEVLVAVTRPAGVLPWGDLPIVVGLLAAATCATLVAALAAAAAAFRSSLLAALPGTETSGRKALPTLVEDVGELVPPARRLVAASFSHPAVLVGLVAVGAFAAVVASQHASPALPAFALGLFEAAAIVVGFLLLGRPLGLRSGRAH